VGRARNLARVAPRLDDLEAIWQGESTWAGYDGPYWVGGMVARSWRDLVASPDAAEQLQRMLASARQKADAGSKVHAGIADELERELAQLKRTQRGEE